MKILSIDTSTNHCSLAVNDGDRVLAQWNGAGARGRRPAGKAGAPFLEDTIIPAIDRILKTVRVTLTQLDGFAVGLGPGSFTSLRVGLTTIKALCFATGKPVVGISSLDALAMNVDKDGPVCAVTDARRQMVYACFYRKKGRGLKRDSEYLLITLENLFKRIKGPLVFVGDGIPLIKEGLKRRKHLMTEEKGWYPRAAFLGQLALERFKAKTTDDPSDLVPLYLYPEDCQVRN